MVDKAGSKSTFSKTKLIIIAVVALVGVAVFVISTQTVEQTEVRKELDL